MIWVAIWVVGNGCELAISWLWLEKDGNLGFWNEIAKDLQSMIVGDVGGDSGRFEIFGWRWC